MMAVDLWRHGAGDKILRVCQELGISVNAAAARRCVDHISREYKDELQSWKKATGEVNDLNTSHYVLVGKLTSIEIIGLC
jgi:hypothetical protein